jgi:hypothetical protein
MNASTIELAMQNPTQEGIVDVSRNVDPQAIFKAQAAESAGDVARSAAGALNRVFGGRANGQAVRKFAEHGVNLIIEHGFDGARKQIEQGLRRKGFGDRSADMATEVVSIIRSSSEREGVQLQETRELTQIGDTTEQRSQLLKGLFKRIEESGEGSRTKMEAFRSAIAEFRKTADPTEKQKVDLIKSLQGIAGVTTGDAAQKILGETAENAMHVRVVEGGQGGAGAAPAPGSDAKPSTAVISTEERVMTDAQLDATLGVSFSTSLGVNV